MNKKIMDFYGTDEGRSYFVGHVYKKEKTSGTYGLKNNMLFELPSGTFFDKNGFYDITKEGYRSPELTKNVDLLTGGCSNTWGLGVGPEYIWPFILSSDKYSIANVAEPGISAEKIVKNCISYMNVYGAPKNIFCVFPDMFRNDFFSDPDFHVYKHLAWSDDGVSYSNSHSETIDWNDNKKIRPVKKIIKTPFLIEEQISPHQFIYQYINYIYILETICKLNNINFVWTSWHLATGDILDSLFEDERFYLNKDNYIPPKAIIQEPDFFADYDVASPRCSQDHNHIMKDHESWNLGTDRNTHPGVHWHYHIAKLFEGRIKC
jgi:hypothetical protein